MWKSLEGHLFLPLFNTPKDRMDSSEDIRASAVFLVLSPETDSQFPPMYCKVTNHKVLRGTPMGLCALRGKSRDNSIWCTKEKSVVEKLQRIHIFAELSTVRPNILQKA